MLPEAVCAIVCDTRCEGNLHRLPGIRKNRSCIGFTGVASWLKQRIFCIPWFLCVLTLVAMSLTSGHPNALNLSLRRLPHLKQEPCILEYNSITGSQACRSPILLFRPLPRQQLFSLFISLFFHHNYLTLCWVTIVSFFLFLSSSYSICVVNPLVSAFPV